MNIIKAKAAARLLHLLYKFKIISEKRYLKLIDDLTVRSVLHQIKEKQDGCEPSEETK